MLFCGLFWHNYGLWVRRMTGKKLLTPENLREYQRLITDHQLSIPRNAIWAGMGLGKGAATLTTIDARIMAGEDAPTLVLGPLRVARDVWPDEAKKWSHTKHLNITPIIGTEKERIAALKYDSEIFTTNYEQIPWLVEHLGTRWPFKNIVADESSKLKGFRLRQGGQRTAALGKVAHTYVKSFTELTGSHAPNGLKDLWGPLWYVDRGNRLGRTFSAFTQRWFKASPDGYGSIAMPHAQGEIEELLRDVCLTIDAKDYFDLKDPIIRNIGIVLPKKVRELYKELEKKYFMELECGTVIDAVNGAARSSKLLQCCSGAVYLNPEVDNDSHKNAKEFRVLHDEKLDALDDIMEETGGTPLLVAYQFKSDLARLRKRYPQGKWLSDKTEMEEFKTGKFQLGFGHPKSMGHGVDGLQQHCFTAVNFSGNWNLEEHEQIMARIGPVRQIQAGFDRSVFVYNLIAEDTIDEVVAERLITKASVQDSLREAMKRRKEKD